MTSSQLEILTQINLDDLVSSFGWEKYPLLASSLRFLFARPARKFASQMVEFDNAVGQKNLAEASKAIMRKYYVNDVRVHGIENIPQNVPALFLSNHPGMADTISLFAAINRTDLKIIALHRSFLESLANTMRQLFFINDEPSRRMSAVRQVSSHLRNGGSVLTFPAGEIEPDPLVYSGATAALNKWTDSAGIFIRFAQDTKIVPVLVSGVIWERTARHWLTKIKRTRLEREKLAAALQLLAMITHDAKPTTVHVQFAKPITLDEIGSTDSQAIHAIVIERMRELLETLSSDDGVSAL
jgi:1-acyl-sn-glycerol-3-phosphate acyltransferase